MFVQTVSLVLVVLVGQSFADSCPKIVTQNPFSVTNYLGQWYEVYRSNVVFEIGSKCVNATYTANPDGSVGVWNQELNWLDDYLSIHGNARVKNASEPAAFIVTFDNPIQQGSYNVITSDYNSYSLVYSCSILPIVEKKIEFIWILSRTKTISDAVLQELTKILSDMGADVKALSKTNQNC